MTNNTFFKNLHSSFLFYFQLYLVQITLQKLYAFLFNQTVIHVTVPWIELCAPHRHTKILTPQYLWMLSYFEIKSLQM